MSTTITAFSQGSNSYVSTSVGHDMLNARYYDGSRGQFTVQDRVFLALGDPRSLSQLGPDQKKLLADPQLMNSYGYGRDNPLVNKDPTGLLSANTVFRGLDLISNVMFGQTALDYFAKTPGETRQEVMNDNAQFYADGTMFVAGLAASSLSPPGIALNVGGLTLYGLDKYCGGHTCRNFDPGERTPEETARAVLSGDTKYLPTRATNVQTNNTPQLSLQQTVARQFNSARQSVAAQISSIQSQINSIRAQLNTLMKQRSSGQSKPAP